MLLNEVAKKRNIDDDLPDIYPEFDLPLTEKTAKKLYKDFNKQYFGNALPSNLPIDIRPSKSHPKALGVATFYSSKGKMTNQYITMHPKLKHRKPIVNVLLHEMIHIQNQNKFVTSGNRDFLDNVVTKYDRKEGHIKGHGSHFTKEMNRLNGIGFEISRTADIGSFMEIDPVWVFVGTLRSGQRALCYSDTDITKVLNTVLQSVSEKSGVGMLTSYTIVTTDNPHATQLSKVTKAGKLGKSVSNIDFNILFANEMMSGGKYIRKDVEVDAGGEGVPTEIHTIASSANKNFRAKTFEEYMYIVFSNAPEFKHAAAIVGKDSYNYPAKIEGVSDEVTNHLYILWSDVTDSEIRSQRVFKYIPEQVKDVLDGNITVKQYLTKTETLYDENFKDRVDEKRYYKLMFDKIVTTLTAKFKKWPILITRLFPDYMAMTKKDITKELKLIFKGTKLG